MTRPRRPPKDNTLPPFTRRQFLGSALAAGALAGLPPGLFAGIQGRSGKPPKPRFERRTYFFNFAHEVGHDTATYYLVAGGNRYSLSRVQDHPHILKRHRKRNKFLQDVPDHQLTHLVENIRLSADFVTMSYVVQNPDTSAGTWSMSGMYLLPPMSGIMAAAQRMVDSAGADPIPLSAKRELYGHPAAWAAEDLQEESILLDPSEHATAIIGMHPDLLGVDGESGTIVQQTYIQPNAATIGLTVLLQEVGPATPQQTPGQPNATGWATLTPIVDDSTGQPFRNQNGNNKGLIQYHPAWSSTISDVAQQGVTGILPSVKADTTLGGDVTGADPSVPGPSGALWKRHDGFTTIDQSPGLGSVQDTLRFTLNTQNTESGFSATGSATETNGTVNATLTFTNWFVRWLGIYLLFLDNTGAPVDPANVQASVPPDYATDASTREQLNQELAMFGLLLGPEFTLLGIPVAAATATLGFNMPAAATTVRVFASGPSMRESSAPSTPTIPRPGETGSPAWPAP